MVSFIKNIVNKIFHFNLSLVSEGVSLGQQSEKTSTQPHLSRSKPSRRELFHGRQQPNFQHCNLSPCQGSFSWLAIGSNANIAIFVPLEAGVILRRCYQHQHHEYLRFVPIPRGVIPQLNRSTRLGNLKKDNASNDIILFFFAVLF